LPFIVHWEKGKKEESDRTARAIRGGGKKVSSMARTGNEKEKNKEKKGGNLLGRAKGIKRPAYSQRREDGRKFDELALISALKAALY